MKKQAILDGQTPYRAAAHGPIGVFDSGVGGLNILSALKNLMPGEDYIYVADSSHAPYGDKPLTFLESRVDAVANMLVRAGAKAVVVACNTATNVGIKHLRERHKLPFIGVEPPVKPAAAEVQRGKILVLCTPVTAAAPKFSALLNRCGGAERFIVRPLDGLAKKIEDAYPAFGSLKPELDETLSAHCDVSAVVLGCTHYYFLKDEIKAYYGGAVPVYDACDGVARHTHAVLALAGLLKEALPCGRETFVSI